MELIGPTAGPVKLKRSKRAVHHALAAAPSVLFDAVVLLPGPTAAAELAERKSAKDFVADAFGNQKFIAHNEAVEALLEAAGVSPGADDGVVSVDADTVGEFVDRAAELRHWARVVRP